MNVKTAENEILVSASALRTAMLFMGRKDPREYLNGVCLSPTGKVAASNGHVLFFDSYNFQLESEIIIKPHNNIPTKALQAKINVDSRTIVLYDESQAIVTELMFEYVEGNFPNVEKLIPSEDLELENKPIGFNPNYLKLLPKAFPMGCVMRAAKDEHGILFTSEFEPKRKVVLMPIRS